jgi:hypothetical protein
MSEHAGSHAAPHGWFRAAGRSLVGALQLLAVAGVFAGDQLVRRLAVSVLGLNAIDEVPFRPGPPVVVADHHRLDSVALGLYAPGMADTVMFDGIVDTTDAGSGRRSRPATS